MPTRMAAFATIAALALAGCVGLPESGPVSAGSVEEGAGIGDVEFIAEGPVDGATQEEIVQGFLQAALSPADDFSIAREYLADGAGWDPTAGVTLRSGQPQLTSTDDTTVEATLDVVGAVDARGVLSPLADDAARRAFVLIEERGEWRIAEAPDGLVLSRFSFERLFDPQQLAWYAEDGATFVPEVRWFQRANDGLANAIVDAVLGGPVAWLAPAVVTAADADTVRVGDVVLEEDLAQVTVSFEQVQESSAVELSQLALQIQQSMARLGVAEVVVAIDGVDGYSASSGDAPAARSPIIDARPVVLAGGELAYAGAGLALAGDLAAGLDVERTTSLTIREEDPLGVALADGEVLRLAPGVVPVVLDTGITVPPSLDRSGWAWWVRDPGAQAIVVSDGASEALLPLPDLQGVIRDVEVSRDGARIAIVTDLAGGTAVWVAGIVRQDGVPTSVAPPSRMPQVTGAAVDVTWVNGASLAVLTSTQDAAQQLVLLVVGGTTQQLATPQDSVTQLAGGIGAAAVLRARSSLGELLVLRAGRWQVASEVADVRLVALQI